jgi:L-ribulokinase
VKLVAGVDFGTQSVRVTLIDPSTGNIAGKGITDYTVFRTKGDPLRATQSHSDQIDALAKAVATALEDAESTGDSIEGIACATTGSSVIFTDDSLTPVSDYYLWCDHRAYREAEEITQAAAAAGLEALDYCGGKYSHEWGYAKLLHFLRNNPDLRASATLAIENCDMIAATLCGVDIPNDLVRSTCAMGHKWMWSDGWGGYPSDEFFETLDPLLANVSKFLRGTVRPQGEAAGTLCSKMSTQLGLTQGIAVAIGAFDAHWDAIGVGASVGDMVNVIGTSTCMIGVLDSKSKPVAGICGSVPGSVFPDNLGIEAGLSAVGDVFEATARRCNTPLSQLSQALNERPHEITGLLRLPWDNGDRTILVNSSLAGMLIGLDLKHTAVDELQAAIEGTAFHTRIILEQIESTLPPFTRIVNGGGIPAKNNFLNQVYADILQKDVYVPVTPTTGIGSCIFAAVAAGIYPDIASAQKVLCPEFSIVKPRPEFVPIYDALYAHFLRLYRAFGAGIQQDFTSTMALLRELRLS